MKKKLLSLFALALMGGATAMATTLSDLTATNVNATYSIAGDFYTQDTPNTTDGGGWTVTYTGSGWGNAANNNLWFWACSAVNISKTVELPAGTYIMHTTLPLLNGGRCAFAAFAGSTATFSSSDGYADASALGRTSADATQSNVNLYVPFYVSAQGNVTMAYNVIWGSKEFQISQFTLYAVKEGETAGDYTSLLATTAQMESVIAGMSEAKQALKVKLTEANALYTDTENKVGTALFQYKTANRTALNTAIYAAQAVFDNLSSTDDDFTAQTTALTTAINAMSTEINAPDTSKYYFISQQDGSSVDWYLNASATTGTLQPYVSTLPYVMQFEATEVSTQFYLKTASGKYITTNNNAWAAIINETAEAWTVAPNDDGSVSFVSTAQSAKLSPWGLTMEWNVGLTTSYANWTVSEATQNSATASVGSAKWATFVAPFEVTLPASVTAYSCTYADGNLAVTETGSQTIAANTPVLLQSETTWSQTFTDYAQYYYNGKPASNSLIGTFLESELPSDGTAYLLQTQDGVTGFYQLTTANISSTANRAYLYIPAAGARQFIPLFEGETTAIDAVTTESSAAEVYSLSGIRTKQMTKGLNIVRAAGGQVKKVLR